MSGKTKYPRAAAIAVARELCKLIEPACVKLIVAGSLRRRKDLVGDVELIFVPRVEPRPDPGDLLGHVVQTDLVESLLTRWLQEGIINRRPKVDGSYTWGSLNKLAVHCATGVPVDLFAGREANWWNLVVFRTGSAESNTRIASAAEKRGMRWDPYSPGFLDRLTNDLVRRVSSEREVFEAVGLEYLEPWER